MQPPASGSAMHVRHLASGLFGAALQSVLLQSVLQSPGVPHAHAIAERASAVAASGSSAAQHAKHPASRPMHALGVPESVTPESLPPPPSAAPVSWIVASSLLPLSAPPLPTAASSPPQAPIPIAEDTVINPTATKSRPPIH